MGASESLTALVARCDAAVAKAEAELNANLIMSVKYDVKTQSQYANHISSYLQNKRNLRIYNPNSFSKKQCGRECCINGYGCRQYPFDPQLDGNGKPGNKPTMDDCWQTSYRWHMECPDAWGTAGKAVVMLCIVEDGQLGPGQVTEKKMADAMGMLRLEMHVERILPGERSGDKLDKALDDVDQILFKNHIL